MDQEALAASSEALPDEHLQSASAAPETKSEVTQPQAETPAPAATDAASATANEGEEPNPDAPPPEQPQKFKGGFQKRIDELTRRSYEAERRAQALEHQLQQRAQAAQQQEAPKPPPRLEDFQDFNQFMEARDKWVKDEAKAEILREAQEATQQQQVARQQHERAIAVQQVVERFKATEADAMARYPDYTEAVQSPLMQQLKQERPDVAEAVIDSPHGPHVVYHLAKNPALVHEIARLSPFAAAREIGRIEQMFMRPQSQQTNAPAPPRSVGGNASVTKDPSAMSMAEYRAWRSKQSK
jgi:hypothetical protein